MDTLYFLLSMEGLILAITTLLQAKRMVLIMAQVE